MNIIEKIASRIRLWLRERDTMSWIGFCSYCPQCKDLLNDQAKYVGSSELLNHYMCAKCGCVSSWDGRCDPPKCVMHKEAEK